MTYTLRASVRGTNQLARLSAALHRRDVRPTYAAYRDHDDDVATAIFVVRDHADAERARRVLDSVVTVTRVQMDGPRAIPAHGRRHQVRHTHPVQDAFARVYR